MSEIMNSFLKSNINREKNSGKLCRKGPDLNPAELGGILPIDLHVPSLGLTIKNAKKKNGKSA